MTADIRPGMKLVCTDCATELIVVRAAPQVAEVTCGGRALVPASASAERSNPSATGTGTLLGKRYSPEDGSFELLCTKGGSGQLMLAGAALPTAAPKSIPSSD